MAQISGRVADARTAAARRVRWALDREERARRALEEAQEQTAASVVLARMVGVTWPALASESGMSKQSLVERVSRWGRRARLVEVGTRFSLPSLARDGGEVPVLDDGQPLPALWSDPLVQEGVAKGCQWVREQTLAAAGRSADPRELVELCRVNSEVAAAAGLAEARRLETVPGTGIASAARSVFQAVVHAGPDELDAGAPAE